MHRNEKRGNRKFESLNKLNIISVIDLILLVVLLYLLYNINILPTKYLILVISLLLIINIFGIVLVNLKKKVLLTYGAECVIYASRMLKDKDFISYVKKLKKNKIANKMYSYNKKKSIKKLVAILNVRLYNKLFGRN